MERYETLELQGSIRTEQGQTLGVPTYETLHKLEAKRASN